MTNNASLSFGQRGPLSAIIRGFVLVAAAIGGFFILAASAAFAFFVLIGLVILGAGIFAVMWVRMKFFGRRTAKQFRDFQESMTRNQPVSDDGPILDAHQTPDGWSVED